MLENIRLSFQGVWSHKMRSFLTMLGIIIGIASIISIVSTIRGTNEQIKQNLIGSGNNVVKVQLYQDDWVFDPTYSGLPDGIPVINNDVYDEILDVEKVVSAAMYNRRTEYNNAFYYGNTELQGTEVYGIDNGFFTTTGYNVVNGRFFSPKDFNDFRPVVIIDENTASSLFQGENPVGKTIEYQSTAFIIIGVVREVRKYEPVINSIDDYYTYMQNSSAGKVFFPHVVWPLIFAYDEPQEVVVRAETTEDMSFVGKAVADILNNYVHNDSINYRAENLLQKAKELQDLSNATSNQLIWIASISLLVGGIGVMNIMLVSVTERTREIGLKKAIGARKSKIRWQFLTEAVVLTSLGGIIGVITGIALSQFISRFSQTPSAISVSAILMGVAFSMLIGIIFGIIPSIKASNLNPIDALRHE